MGRVIPGNERLGLKRQSWMLAKPHEALRRGRGRGRSVLFNDAHSSHITVILTSDTGLTTTQCKSGFRRGGHWAAFSSGGPPYPRTATAATITTQTTAATTTTTTNT